MKTGAKINLKELKEEERTKEKMVMVELLEKEKTSVEEMKNSFAGKTDLPDDVFEVERDPSRLFNQAFGCRK